MFAALNVIDVTVLAKCELRHRHQEFLSFLREIDKAVPMELDIHCIIDNYADPQSPEDQGLGPRSGLVGTCTSFPPTAPGLIKWSASLR
ncbi:hypothetical protein ACVIHH_008314 [Bradyrhizobium sp. USDA 4518]